MSSSDHKQSPPPGPDQQHSYPTYPPFTPGFPPGAYPPPFYTYVPPGPDGAHGENGQPPQPPHPYMMYPPPPGMVYAYPPGQPFYGGQPNNGRPTKRKQVKMACTNCAVACKRCDEARPCERCIKYGLADQCQDGVRKERKKGVKRGPYKRKAKATSTDGASFTAFTQPDGEDWSGGGSPGTSSANATTTVLAHAMPPYPGPPSNIEGYYPYYYTSPGGPGFMQPPQGHESQPHPDGSPNQQSGPNNGPPVQFFPVHPGYAQFPHYSPVPPPGSYHMHHSIQQHPQTIDPKRATANRQESEEDDDDDDEKNSTTHPPTLVPVPAEPTTAPSQKKRTKTAKTAASGGEPKAKKVKTSKKADKTASSLVEPAKQKSDASGSG